MFDYTCDIEIEISRITREAIRRINDKLAAKNLGEAFRDLAIEEDQEAWPLAA